MLRTICASVSLYGATLSRTSLKPLHAEEESQKVSKFADTRERVNVTSYFEVERENPWMAEPLTDEETRNENKEKMRTRMELMVMKVNDLTSLFLQLILTSFAGTARFLPSFGN